jgi:hypothetical protein
MVQKKILKFHIKANLNWFRTKTKLTAMSYPISGIALYGAGGSGGGGGWFLWSPEDEQKRELYLHFHQALIE